MSTGCWVPRWLGKEPIRFISAIHLLLRSLLPAEVQRLSPAWPQHRSRAVIEGTTQGRRDGKQKLPAGEKHGSRWVVKQEMTQNRVHVPICSFHLCQYVQFVRTEMKSYSKHSQHNPFMSVSTIHRPYKPCRWCSTPDTALYRLTYTTIHVPA